MTKTYDTTLKELFNDYPQDLLRLLNINVPGPVKELPTNLTANIDTDLVLGFGDPLRGILDINLQVDWDPTTPARVLAYNAMLWRNHDVPVSSVVVMLRSRGNDLRMDAPIRYSFLPEIGYTEFQVGVVRVWEIPLEATLTAGLGLIPMAMLAAMPEGLTREEAMPEILRRVEERLVAEKSSEARDLVVNWMYQLAGLHFTADEVQAMFRRSNMISEINEKSSTYQGLLQKGRTLQLQESVLQLASKRFGQADETAKARIQSILDASHLKRVMDAILEAKSWAELLQTP